MASYGRSSLPFASLLTLKTLQTLKHPLGMLTPQLRRAKKIVKRFDVERLPNGKLERP
jgi:hypothetical protein